MRGEKRNELRRDGTMNLDKVSRVSLGDRVRISLSSRAQKQAKYSLSVCN